MKKITAALIGAGGRGGGYAAYAIKHPDQFQVVAVAEPNDERREKFKNHHAIKRDMCFNSWEELLDKPKLADAVLICTQDRMHFEPTIKALEKGYHILLEKPMATTPEECIIMGECARKLNRVFAICHVLRYTGFFSTIKKLLDEGRIGRLISIQHNENVGYWHHAHSFVRGNWRISSESSPMILAKSCHDMDLLLWLAGADCVNLSSFGSLTHFRKESAPPGAPERCVDGCPVEKECPYSAVKLYLTEEPDWPTYVMSGDGTMKSIRKALKEGPYGRCVYHCDNDVVDHQVVCMEFSNEVTAAFTMCAFTELSRTIKLMGTKGEIRGYMEKCEIEVKDFCDGSSTVITLEESPHGHGGGDYGIMQDFVRLVASGDGSASLTSAAVSMESHLMAFAAEQSRLEKKVVNMDEYVRKLKSRIGTGNL